MSKTKKNPPRIVDAVLLVKSAIGDCIDELPYEKIQAKLWDVVKVLYEIRRAGKR